MTLYPLPVVASFTDAWIETLNLFRFHKLLCVASFTDAWIETLAPGEIDKLNEVASFTDAWIETQKVYKKEGLKVSHLLQMRGLKLMVAYILMTGRKVASFTDAWIETLE